MKPWHIIAICSVIAIVGLVLYLRGGNKDEPKYEAELSSQIETLKKESDRLKKRADSLSHALERAKSEVAEAHANEKRAEAVADAKERENQSLIERNKKKRDENNTNISNSSADKLTKDILADYGDSSEKCCG